jgi:hypothetical protein
VTIPASLWTARTARTARTAKDTLCLLTIGLVLALAPARAAAQADEEVAPDGRVQLGPLAVRPEIGWQMSYDDNVFRSAEQRETDVISTLRGASEIQGQLRRIGVSASGSAEWVHFDRLVDERGANVTADARLDFSLNRIVPYVGSAYHNTRQRLNAELDTRPRTERSNVSVGSVFHIGGRSMLDVSARRSVEEYDQDAAADGVNLSQALNHASDSFTLAFLQDVAPLTRLTVTGEIQRDRFRGSPSRDADNVRLTAGFTSEGLINGRAHAGVRILTPHDPTLPEFRGFFLGLGTTITLADRLRIGLDAQRDVAPSYRQLAYYEYYSYGASFTYAVRDSLRLSGNVGRRLADYRATSAVTPDAIQADEDDELMYGADVSYGVGDSMRIDVGGTYTERTSTSVSRQFDGLSFKTGVRYAF